MQGKKIILSAVAALTALTFAAAPAFAVMSVPCGWYLEGSGGSTHLSNISYPGNVSSSGIGGNANLGYKFMPYFAAEMGYTLYANTNIKNGANTTAGTVKYYSYDLAGKGILPIAGSGFEAFGKLGVERLNAHVSLNNATAANQIGLTSSQHSATGLYLGAGAQYYFMPEMAVVAEWARAIGSSNGTGTMDLYSLGVSFIFD
jgi:opacity protein-like surface antigen